MRGGARRRPRRTLTRAAAADAHGQPQNASLAGSDDPSWLGHLPAFNASGTELPPTRALVRLIPPGVRVSGTICAFSRWNQTAGTCNVTSLA